MEIQIVYPEDAGSGNNKISIFSPIANALSKVLADSYVLYLKTHNYHWNVTGKLFHSLHEQFEEQYSELTEAVEYTLKNSLDAAKSPGIGCYIIHDPCKKASETILRRLF